MKKLISTFLILTLTGCGAGAGYRPIVDKKNANYETDLSACQKLASEREFMNDDSKIETGLSAVTGAGVGAVAGNAYGGNGGEGALIGLGAGLVLGAIGSAMKDKEEQKAIVINCMKGRGHKVVENDAKTSGRY